MNSLRKKSGKKIPFAVASKNKILRNKPNQGSERPLP
jgi:hypothetical protein